MKLKFSKNKGFTLLELLIVIAIIAILSVALVIVLNPAEAIKKSRDSQRISDVNTLKKAIGIYVTNTASPKLGGTDNVGCKGTTSDANNWQPATDKVWYSYPSDSPGAPITGTSTQYTAVQVTKANLNLTNGQGWIPINFSSLADGSPISNIPVDPINTIATPATPTNTDLVYRYTCSEKDLTYEINATLESDAYTITDNKMAKDGGNSDLYYESGTNLNVMAGESFAGPIVDSYGNVYGTVTIGAQIWLDRNLGATQVATSPTDSAAFGYLYQWGRGNDDHQFRTSATTSTTSSSDSVSLPNTTKFITNGSVSPYDWHLPQNNNLWQGVNGTNNPCPTGFRLPTYIEWLQLATAIGGFTTATCGGSSSCLNVAYNSILKLPSGGYRDSATAIPTNVNTYGIYYSSSHLGGTGAYSLLFYAAGVYPLNTNNFRALGYSVRCIKN